ncbi:MAG: histidinol-phosphate transaminase [Clostridium sp.]|uniref:pyridoxal phosphate-dependent aminotransferase n=1 Tax=Clostridium sp. TaxID=1506 RepID=UPI002FC66E8B
MAINHGANLFELSKELGLKTSEILDFSSNINPFGASKKAKEAVIKNIDMASIYPDPKYIELKKSISNYCDSKIKDIVLGAGATELISSFINIIDPRRALLICPAYSEYERELKKNKCEIIKYFAIKENEFKIDIEELKKKAIETKCNLIVICNPNNPTGFAFNKGEIEKLLKGYNGFVMVDETYVEFTNTNLYSVSSLVNNYNNLFVIRGTSKFFSTPGIRLGYGLISNESVRNKILEKLDLWNINIFAEVMGTVMFKDCEYIEDTIKHMADERAYLNRELKCINGIRVYDSKGNFILCEIEKNGLTVDELYNSLIKEGIIIRNCSSFEGLNNNFFRVCVLKHNENELLIKKLKSIIK